MGHFAIAFKELRLKKDLTQRQMAEKLKICRSSVGMYENGEREPSFELLENIADCFNVDMNYLLGKKEPDKHIPKGYYLNEDSREAAQFLYENPDYKVLFDAIRKVKQQDIKIAKEMIDRVINKD